MLPQRPYFNPLYEALVFAAVTTSGETPADDANFNPLYEALVFAAWEPMIPLAELSEYFNPLYEALVFAAHGRRVVKSPVRPKFQSSIRGFSFCGLDTHYIYLGRCRTNFNPLYEALVFAAS